MQLNELKVILKCPIDWQNIGAESELQYWMNFMWFASCHKYQIDREVNDIFSFQDYQIDECALSLLDDIDISAILLNVHTWIENSHLEYFTYARRFALLTSVGKKTYSKHYTNQLKSIPKLQNQSVSRGASKLLPIITSVIQEKFAWSALDYLILNWMSSFYSYESFSNPAYAVAQFKSLFDNHKLVILVDFCRIIGVSNGQPTNYGCINYDFSTPQFHIYPVCHNEYQTGTHKVYVQAWNYGL